MHSTLCDSWQLLTFAMVAESDAAAKQSDCYSSVARPHWGGKPDITFDSCALSPDSLTIGVCVDKNSKYLI